MFNKRETFGEKAYAVFAVGVVFGVLILQGFSNYIVFTQVMSLLPVTISTLAAGFAMLVGGTTIQVMTMNMFVAIFEKFDPARDEDTDGLGNIK